MIYVRSGLLFASPAASQWLMSRSKCEVLLAAGLKRRGAAARERKKKDKKKKGQCHLVTLGRAAKLLAGGWSGHNAEEGWLW